MRIFNSVRMNLYKILTGYGFYVCIAFMVLLCFSAELYYDTMKNESYSVFGALKSFDDEFMLKDATFCSFNVIQKANSGWLSMFIPIISAFAFIPIVCDEFEAKAVRFEVFRGSKLTYSLSKFITACISGGLAVFIGYLVFVLLVYFLFPDISEYSQTNIEFYIMGVKGYFPEIEKGFMLPVLKIAFHMFLYGALCAVPAITLTAVIKNKYLVLCIPFFIKYAVGQTVIKLQNEALSDYENINQKLMDLAFYINPDALSFAYQYKNMEASHDKRIYIYSTILCAVAIVFYLFAQSRRCDCGE